jgi:amino acid transporter
MASSGVEYGGPHDYEKGAKVEPQSHDFPEYRRSSMAGSVKTVRDSTHRKLKPRHIQLIGIGGTIGTALYVQIGRGLMNGGPASLFLAFSIWYARVLLQIHCNSTDKRVWELTLS